MRREASFEEISDGHRYTSRDLVKLGCGGCRDCSECCRNQGVMIVTDPYDIYSLEKETGKSFSELLGEGSLRLQLIDGLIQPGLGILPEEGKEVCVFLDPEGRCSIHRSRPGICRLYPLGRIYEGDGFSYFLQPGECGRADGTKIRIEKWLGIPDLRRYETYILSWHKLLKALEPDEEEKSDPAYMRKLNDAFLRLFFVLPYDTEADFYPQFEERLKKIGA